MAWVKWKTESQKKRWWFHTYNMHKLEKASVKSGMIRTGFENDVAYFIHDKLPFAAPDGKYFQMITKRIASKFPVVLTDFIWKKIIEGHEFIFPYGNISILLIEVNTPWKQYAELFHNNRAVFIEMRRMKRITQRKYLDNIRGTIRKGYIEKVAQKQREGVSYQKKSQYFIDKKGS